MPPISTLPARVTGARRESKTVEFKEKFDPTSSGEWCELLKDIVAMANSGGGYVLFGVNNYGSSSGWDPAPVLTLDPATITDKIAKYTGEQFHEFAILEVVRQGASVAVLSVGDADMPLVFSSVGNYLDACTGKQKTAFGVGTFYVRHGAKSAPGNTTDLRKLIEKRVERLRSGWLKDIKRVIEAPSGSVVHVLGPDITESGEPTAIPIRIVADQSAPGYRKLDPDITHPHRQKEVIALVNKRLPGGARINSHDILCVRRAHEIEGRPEFFHSPKFASPQYSEAFVDWLVAEYEGNASFFTTSRARAKGEEASSQYQLTELAR